MHCIQEGWEEGRFAQFYAAQGALPEGAGTERHLSGGSLQANLPTHAKHAAAVGRGIMITTSAPPLYTVELAQELRLYEVDE